MEFDEFKEYLNDVAEESGVAPIDIQMYEDTMRMSETISIRKRFNGQQYGADHQVTQEEFLLEDDADFIQRELEQQIRSIAEIIIENESQTYDYRGREITVTASAPQIIGLCEDCYYRSEFENECVKMQTTGSTQTKPITSIIEQQVLEMWLLEHVHRNCFCNRKI